MDDTVYLVTLTFDVRNKNTLAVESKGSEEATAEYIVSTYTEAGASNIEILDISEAPVDVVEDYMGYRESTKRSLN